MRLFVPVVLLMALAGPVVRPYYDMAMYRAPPPTSRPVESLSAITYSYPMIAIPALAGRVVIHPQEHLCRVRNG